MNLYNATEFATGYTLGIQKSGRNCLVMVAKASYHLPTKEREFPTLLDEQIAPYETDSYTGEPGYSSPIYENDYATHKPKCDVILNGSAHAKKDHEATVQPVRLQLNELDKTFHVVGARYWKKSLLDWEATPAEPFTQQSISYDTAYGGTAPLPKKDKNDEQLYTSLMENPVGIGYCPNQQGKQREGQALPLTQAIDQPIKNNKGTDYSPQSFGCIARNWSPRSKLGGTYDDAWSDNVKPFLPTDFDEHYYQCAPLDQQIDYPKGGETITLVNLTPEGHTEFQLPQNNIPMQAMLSNGERHNLAPVIDTLTIEPDKGYFSLVWRARIGLKRNVHEVDTLIIGKPSKGWERARMMDKLYLPLHKLNAFKKYMQKQYAEEQRIRDKNNATQGSVK